MLACSFAGYFILTPGDYIYFSKSGLFSLVGAANYFFFYNTGYFDAAANTMPLLHTWSLGVEEQFYLIWPTVFFIFMKLFPGKKYLAPLFVSIVAASLGLNFLTLQSNPMAAFYMPYTRAWELALGGGISLLPRIKGQHLAWLSETLPLLGIATIIFAVIGPLKSATHSLQIYIITASGSGLFLYDSGRISATHRFFSNKVFVFYGLISYYLYHWPIIVFLRHYSGAHAAEADEYALVIALSTFMAWFSWAYIELPCRRLNWSWKRVVSVFLLSESIAGCFCAVILLTAGVPQRIPTSLQAIRALNVMWDWPCPHHYTSGGKSLCVGGKDWKTAKFHVVVWGDSNATHFMSILDAAARNRDISIALVEGCTAIVNTHNIAIFTVGLPNYMENCDGVYREAMSLIENDNVNLVILASAWSPVTAQLIKKEGDIPNEAAGLELLETGLRQLLPQISAKGRAVAIVSDIPHWPADPVPCVITEKTSLLRSSSLREACRGSTDRLDKAYFNRTQKKPHDILRHFDGINGVSVLSPEDFLCDGTSCTSKINGEFIYRDEGHLRRNLTYETDREISEIIQFNTLLDMAEGKSLPQ